MSSFDAAIIVVLRHEGGYCYTEGDAGGETNFGISKRSYPDLDIKNLTPADACMIYRRDWWDRFGYGRLLDQSIATKIFDTAVNMGPVPAHKIAQEAASATTDGILGPESITAINAQQASALLPRMQDLQAARYREIATERPQDVKFLKNWLDRAYDRA
jgi:lysozyme family protein